MTTAAFLTASSSMNTNPQDGRGNSDDASGKDSALRSAESAKRAQGFDSAWGTGSDSGQSGHDATASKGAPDLLNSVAQTAHQTIDRLTEQVAPKVHRLQQSLDGATDRLDDRANQLREITDEWMGALRSTLRDHPLAAVGAALALGLLVARLSR